MKKLFGTQGPPGWLVTGGMACIALVYVFFVFLPAQKAMKTSRSKLLEQQRYIADTDALYNSVSATQTETTQTLAFASQWQQNAPNVQQFDRLPSQVSLQASRAEVRILRLEPQPARRHGLIVEFPILVSVEGSFAGVFEFFRGLEDLPQTIWFEDVNLEKPSEMNTTLRCELTLTILGDLAEKTD